MDSQSSDTVEDDRYRKRPLPTTCSASVLCFTRLYWGSLRTRSWVERKLFDDMQYKNSHLLRRLSIVTPSSSKSVGTMNIPPSNTSHATCRNPFCIRLDRSIYTSQSRFRPSVGIVDSSLYTKTSSTTSYF